MLRPRKQTLDSEGQVGGEREALLSGDINRNSQRNYPLGDDSYYPTRSQPQTSQIQHANNRSNLSHKDPFQPKVPTPVQRKARDKSPPVHYRIKTDLSYHGNASQTIDHLTSGAPTSNQILHRHSLDSYELTNSSSFSRTINISQGEESFSRHQDFIYYTVQPGDTLHNLSVRYSCPVASIKRLNNLWSDQEFYGLSRIKLPAGKLRLIADVIGEGAKKPQTPDQTPNAQTFIEQPGFSQHTTPQTPLSTTVQNSFIHEPIHKDDSDVTSFGQEPNPLGSLSSDSIFKDLDLNIEKARTAARSYDENASAIMQTLAEGGNIVGGDDDMTDLQKIAQREAESLLIDMSDIGLSYNGLVLFVFIACLICPLAYVIYLEETHNDSSKPIT